MKLKKCLKNLLLIPALILSLLSYPVLTPAARIVYGFYGLTGADPGLAGINTTNVDDGSYAFGIDSSGYAYFYYLNKSLSTTQNLPGIVAPLTGPGRWVLAPRIYADSFYTNSQDLYHYLNVSNTTSPAFTPVDGDFYTRTDTGIPYLYNVADKDVIGGGHVPLLNSKIANVPVDGCTTCTGSFTLFTRHMYGCTINNVNASGLVTYVIPKAGYGMQFTVYLGSGQIVRLDPNSSDRIYPTCTANGQYLYNSGVAGSWVTLKTMYLPSDIDYNWYIFSYNGTWQREGL